MEIPAAILYFKYGGTRTNVSKNEPYVINKIKIVLKNFVESFGKYLKSWKVPPGILTLKKAPIQTGAVSHKSMRAPRV